MIIRIYNRNADGSINPMQLPNAWREVCATNTLNIRTDANLELSIQSNNITLSTSAKYDGYVARYDKFIELKQQHMRKGGYLSYDDYTHNFSRDISTLCADNNYLMTINSIPSDDSGNFSIVGGHAVGIAPTSNGVELGVLKQYGETDSRKRVLLEANACLWIIYHKFNELLYRCLKTEYSNSLIGLLNNYYAACLRWDYYVYSKLYRTEIVNSNSVLTVVWGHTCAQCTEDARTVRLLFETTLKLEKVPDDRRLAPDAAAYLLSMSGEYVPYVSPISTNNSGIDPTVTINKKIGKKNVASTGYGDDLIYEIPRGMKYYEAYNNWTSIEISIQIPQLRQGDRVSYIIQLVRGGRSMSGRVLSTADDGLQTFDVDVTVYDPYIDPNNPNYVTKKSTETLIGYVTIVEEEDDEQSS